MKNFKKLSIYLLILCALILGCIIFINKKNIKTTQQDDNNNNTEINNNDIGNNITNEHTGSKENIKTPEKDSTPTYKFIEYENKKYNFKINIPDNRTFQEKNKGFDLILNTQKNDSINENLGIKIQELQTQETLESYTQTTIKGLKDLYETYKEIKKENIKINGIDGVSLTYEMTENGYDLKAQQTVFLKNNKSYVFQYTATKDTFDNYINEISNVIKSFTILN